MVLFLRNYARLVIVLIFVVGSLNAEDSAPKNREKTNPLVETETPIRPASRLETLKLPAQPDIEKSGSTAKARQGAFHLKRSPDKKGLGLDGKLLIGVQGGIGMSFPLGMYQGYENKPDVMFSGSAHVWAGYTIIPHGALILDVAYFSQNVKINRTYFSLPLTTTYQFQFVTISAGYRGEYGFFYFDGRVTIGIPAGAWEEIRDLNGSISQATWMGHPEVLPPVGIGLEGGFQYTFWKFLSLYTGIRLNMNLSPAFFGGDQLWPWSIEWVFGVIVRI